MGGVGPVCIRFRTKTRVRNRKTSRDDRRAGGTGASKSPNSKDLPRKMSISSGSSSSDALNRLTDDSLSTPTKVERSAVPLAHRLPYSYLFSGTLSTGIPFRDHPNPLCAALVPSLGQVWIGTSGGFVCIWTLEAQRQLTRFRASSSSSSIKGLFVFQKKKKK